MEFVSGKWRRKIAVRDFIIRNYTPYDGDESFLATPTDRTLALWDKVKSLMEKEHDNGGVLDIDDKTVSTIVSHKAGYIDRENELIVGLQTDEPLKRAIMPFGGLRMVKSSLEARGRTLDPEIERIFKHRKTHNDGVYDAYTEDMRRARRSGVITGLPDAYGRGRIIGDYRRLPLYGLDYLISQKQAAKESYVFDLINDDVIAHREEMAEQIRALQALGKMAESYNYDISKPATDTKEAIQWLYFAYLAAIKEQNGAAMSLGRVSTFLDIYAQRDLEEGKYTESEIQELVDHFIMKLRMVRFLRTPQYDELFSGDPVWVTESIGGIGIDGRHMVTKMSYRFLHTLSNLGPAPEPNLTVLWSTRLPDPFKKYCTSVSLACSSIQYENDDLMRVDFGDDYGISCCVSAMRIGRMMQFFGARANIAKALLFCLNGGKDENTGEQIGPEMAFPVSDDCLEFDEVWRKYDQICNWLSRLYINTLNIIHYMHDKYCYEKIQMALHDEMISRTSACGLAGLSVVVDSLSAIKYAKVRVIRSEKGLTTGFEVEGDYPKFGNNDERVDSIARDLVEHFMQKLSKHRTYRNSRPTLSILTITSNVVYGKITGATPDGRLAGEPFAPGANPMTGREKSGSLAAMMSVASLPYKSAQDGISYTFSVVPAALGKETEDRKSNLSSLLDAYFSQGGHHMNVNTIERDVLLDAMEHPEKYPQLTIRVSGYAVNFIKLTREQQLDVISRTIHERV